MPLRAETRASVVMRDGGRCRVCREYVGDYGHAHEIVYRSRGGDPCDPENVILLCARHHRLEHEHRIRLRGTASHLTIEYERPDYA